MNNVKIYLDGADLNDVEAISSDSNISGFTSNPSLMRKSGITNYDEFIKRFLSVCNGKPVSFEVVSDSFDSMEKEARKIYSYASNIYVKIPITNSKGDTSLPLIRKLLNENLNINITAILSENQLEAVIDVLDVNDDVIISYFAGRVADTGIDPLPIMVKLKEKIREKKLLKSKILWASPREVFNIYQADSIGVDIITVTKALIDKLKLENKDLDEYSLETVQMFLTDAQKNKFEI